MIGKQNVADLIARAYEVAPRYVSRLVHGDEDTGVDGEG